MHQFDYRSVKHTYSDNFQVVGLRHSCNVLLKKSLLGKVRDIYSSSELFTAFKTSLTIT